MDYLSNIKDIVAGIGSAGFLIGIIIAWKTGLLSYILNLKKNGNGNGYQKQIDELHDHAKIANEEMSDIKKDISAIREDIGFIKGKLS